MDRRSPGLSLSKALVGFLNAKAAEGLSPRTLTNYEFRLKQWIDFAGDPAVESVTPQAIRKYLVWLRTEYRPRRYNGDRGPLSPKSVRNAYMTLSSFFTWAVQEFDLPNPMRRVPAPKFQQVPVEPLSREQVEALLAACDFTDRAETETRRRFRMRRPTAKRDRAIILMLLDTGLRASDVGQDSVLRAAAARQRELSKWTRLQKMATCGITTTMIMPTSEDAVKEAARLLSELLGQKSSLGAGGRSAIERKHREGATLDAFIELNGTTFVVEYKQFGNLRSVEQGINQLKRIKADSGKTVKLLVVPYMTQTGGDRCQSAGISWLDLSGNADIHGPGIRISIHGRRNLYRTPGRPRSPFAPKSSRVARVLLSGDRKEYAQSELVEITGLDKGHLSRIVSALEEDGLIGRLPNGAIRARDPEILLDSWREEYDFFKHSIMRGHISARTGLSLARRLADWLDQESIEYSLTGLASAWFYTQFSDFRTVTVFLARPLSGPRLEKLGFAERESGANTWLVVANEKSVMWEARTREGVRTVHPIQAYLDLKDQPERASDAAEELKKVALARFVAD